jgi:hypothetical protein
LFEGTEAQFDKQNAILEVSTSTLKFPPAIRALHELIKQKTPMAEDRAALTQCLLQYYKTIRDPTRSFDLQFPSLTFGQLYGEVKQRSDSTSRQYLDSIQTEYFICPITKKIVEKGVLFQDGDDTVVIDASIGHLYRNGPLRKTVFEGEQTPLPSSIATRLSVYSGGRFEEISFFNSTSFNTKSTSTITGHQRSTDRQGDPFAIIPPRDLTSVETPALTRDASGQVCVYLGKAACTFPPVEYVLGAKC